MLKPLKAIKPLANKAAQSSALWKYFPPNKARLIPIKAANEVEQQLAPFQETNMGPIAPAFMQTIDWTDEVHEAATIALMAENSWFRGTNIPGKANEYLVGRNLRKPECGAQY